MQSAGRQLGLPVVCGAGVGDAADAWFSPSESGVSPQKVYSARPCRDLVGAARPACHPVRRSHLSASVGHEIVRLRPSAATAAYAGICCAVAVQSILVASNCLILMALPTGFEPVY